MKIKYFTAFFFLTVLNVFSQEWKQNFKIVEPVRATDNDFGFSVVTYDGYAAYGADQVDIGDVENAGKVYIAKQDCDGWTIYQELSQPDARNYCGFGSVLFMEGKILAIVGCDPSVSQGNAVYMYERDTSGQYIFTQKITRDENSLLDNYGSKIAISENFMVVGSSYNSTDNNLNNYLENAGAAYIFFKGTDGVWTLVQKIVASDRERRDTFGNSVAIYKNTIVVGAVDEGTNWAGAAYVFEKNNGSNTWKETKKLIAYDFRGLQDRFGEIVKVNENGIMVSAQSEDDYDSNLSGDGGGPLTMLGSVYIFNKNVDGEWVGNQKIRASDGSAKIFNFGNQMDVYEDRIAVRATEYEYDKTGNLSKVFGRVYMFQKGVNGNWTESQIVQSNVKRNSDWFAGSISLFKDDLFIGAFWDALDANGQNYIGYAGTVYIFNTYNYVSTKKPVLNTIPVLISCADLGNGFSSHFDMSSIEKDLIENPEDFVFSYKDQLGNNLVSPLPTNYSNKYPYNEKISVRVGNKNNPSCYEETKLELSTISSVSLNAIPELKECDYSGTGYATFDLSKINSLLVDNASLYDFSYYDYNKNDISIFINESYKNTVKNHEEITVNVTEKSTSCTAKTKIVLNVSNVGVACEIIDDYDIPKFFTPNGDGVNDLWGINGLESKKYTLYIYDRYGMLLKTFSNNSGWDGSYLGKPLPASDYWFHIVFENGIDKRGHFALKR
ncbi:T9SS type B sorting domain-containing protein [Flavobacterium sp. ov086]|uniref:T9SS type B sorting domain-containing protein n=1 Tax=Flavobacterium sp. ov086 TaxID=1761785 RepID=UPI000B763B6F|nr:T9SS type B sorting domain-containing protein [Flavobacterium sp. ov086]SNR60808.1 gliding motility-associated C-terminal domain-containing protein [Flavobacterium sp. ov086]